MPSFENSDSQERSHSESSQDESLNFEGDLENFDTENFEISDLEEIPASLHSEVATKLIEAGAGHIVAVYVNKFEGLDHNDVAKKLIEAGEGQLVAKHLNRFKGLDHRDIALKLIEAGEDQIVFDKPEEFGGLDNDIAMKLIEAGQSQLVVKNLNKFEGLDHKDIALKLIEAGKADIIRSNIYSFKFKSLDNDVALKLIEAGEAYIVLEQISRFEGLDHNDIATKLIEAGEGAAVAEHFYKFEGLGKDIALKLIDAGEVDAVATNLLWFKGLDNDFALKLIEAGKVDAVGKNLNNFKGLDQDIAIELIETYDGWCVADNIDSFVEMDDSTVAELLVKGLPHGIQSQITPYFESWVSASRPTLADFYLSLEEIAPEIEENPKIVQSLLDPAIKAQGVGAFRVIGELNKILESKAIASEEDEDILRHIATTKGVRAVDVLGFLREGVVGVFDEKGNDDLGWEDDEDFSNAREEREAYLLKPLSSNPHLRSFIDSNMPFIDDLYLTYDSIMENPDTNPSEKNSAINGLHERIREMTERIKSGEMNDGDMNDDTFIGMLYHAFPPAITLDRAQYRNLIGRREDRQDDLPEEWEGLNDSQEAHVKIARGEWVFRDGEQSNTTAWNELSNAVRVVNGEKIKEWDQEAAIASGKRLVEALGDPKRFNKERQELLQEIYAFHRSANGATLKLDLSTREGLLELKEFAGDRMKDTIDLLIDAYAEEDPDGYEKAVKEATTINIKEKAKKGIVKQMLGILGEASMDAEKTNERLKAILDRYGIRAEGDVLTEAIKVIEDISNDDEDGQRNAVRKFLKDLLNGAAMSRNAGKLSVDIANRLLGGDYTSMQEEMGKYEFQEESEGGDLTSFRLEASKKRAHSAAGLNMGVCVAVDEELWNKETFSNVILWDEENIARGGMHFEVVEDGDRKYLSLPGINPSIAAMSQAGAENLYDAMIEYAKEAARRIGAEAVLIPKDAVIHSNRAEIQQVIAGRNYEDMTLEKGDHQFSYDPYDYDWQDAYVIEV